MAADEGLAELTTTINTVTSATRSDVFMVVSLFPKSVSYLARIVEGDNPTGPHFLCAETRLREYTHVTLAQYSKSDASQHQVGMKTSKKFIFQARWHPIQQMLVRQRVIPPQPAE
jgi:hypothetical protein